MNLGLPSQSPVASHVPAQTLGILSSGVASNSILQFHTIRFMLPSKFCAKDGLRIEACRFVACSCKDKFSAGSVSTRTYPAAQEALRERVDLPQLACPVAPKRIPPCSRVGTRVVPGLLLRNLLTCLGVTGSPTGSLRRGGEGSRSTMLPTLPAGISDPAKTTHGRYLVSDDRNGKCSTRLYAGPHCVGTGPEQGAWDKAREACRL